VSDNQAFGRNGVANNEDVLMFLEVLDIDGMGLIYDFLHGNYVILVRKSVVLAL